MKALQSNCARTEEVFHRPPPQVSTKAEAIIRCALEARDWLLEEPQQAELTRLLRQTLARTMSLLIVGFPAELSISRVNQQSGSLDWISVSFPAYHEAPSVGIAFHTLDRSARATAARLLGCPALLAEPAPWDAAVKDSAVRPVPPHEMS
jgi:hypothetical protein